MHGPSDRHLAIAFAVGVGLAAFAAFAYIVDDRQDMDHYDRILRIAQIIRLSPYWIVAAILATVGLIKTSRCSSSPG